jgi:hypothetical protein
VLAYFATLHESSYWQCAPKARIISGGGIRPEKVYRAFLEAERSRNGCRPMALPVPYIIWKGVPRRQLSPHQRPNEGQVSFRSLACPIAVQIPRPTEVKGPLCLAYSRPSRSKPPPCVRGFDCPLVVLMKLSEIHTKLTVALVSVRLAVTVPELLFSRRSIS